MSTPDVSAVVVHHRGPEHLRECLEGLAAASRGIAAETILVDNTGGGDGAAAILAKFPAVRRVDAKGNVGFASGCRLGAEAARAPIVAFVNDDAVVAADALERFAAALASLRGRRGGGGRESHRPGRPP